MLHALSSRSIGIASSSQRTSTVGPGDVPAYTAAMPCPPSPVMSSSGG
jgi:hypothetical protein